MARSLGADHVIDYTQEDFTRNGQSYDLIFAANGNRSISDYKRALSPNGTYVMSGGSTAQMSEAHAPRALDLNDRAARKWVTCSPSQTKRIWLL